MNKFVTFTPPTEDNPSRPVFGPQGIVDRAGPMKVLGVMLKGQKVSRLNCEYLQVAPRNSSIHSHVATIRNRMDIPVESKRIEHNVNEYWIAPEDRDAFTNPRKRKRQAKLCREETQARRFWRRTRGMEIMTNALRTYPEIVRTHPWILDRVRTVAEQALQTVKDLEKRLQKAGAKR